MKKTLALFILITTHLSHAAIVEKVKNDRLLLTFKDEKVLIGDTVYPVQEVITNESARQEESSATILQIKDKQAVAQINSGLFTEKQEVVIQHTTKKNKKKEIDYVVYRYDMLKISILGRLAANSLSTKQQDNGNGSPYPNEEVVDMSGLNIGLMGVVEKPLPWYNKITARGIFTIDPVDVKGSAQYNSCDTKTSKDCNARITYLSFGALARYDFIKAPSIFWGAIGGTLKLPITKKSSSLIESDIKMANSIVLSFGVDFIRNNKIFIPFSFEYHYSLNKSDTVPVINQIAFQGGYGWQF